jgi:hypothetical protein
VAFVSDVKVDVVIDIDTVWGWGGVSLVVKDALVECVAKSSCESRSLLATKGTAPLDFVKDGAVLRDQRGVEEQPLG